MNKDSEESVRVAYLTSLRDDAVQAPETGVTTHLCLSRAVSLCSSCPAIIITSAAVCVLLGGGASKKKELLIKLSSVSPRSRLILLLNK